jgi:hypothetical protein
MCAKNAVQKKTRLGSLTPSSSVALEWTVQNCNPRKFRRTNEGSTGGRNFEKFK